MREEGEVREVCAPRSNIAFLKNHKCASSAVQNILFRYAEQHNLQLALPDASNYFGGGVRPFRSEFYTGSPWSKLGVNIFAIHTKWNHDEIAKIMPNNTVYVTIIRDPTSLFTSLFSYSQFQKRTGLTFDEFIQKTPVEGKRLVGYLGFNQMAWDMGMIKEDINNITKVARMVREASDHFDLVMIAEKMEESLVLLAHLMCWPLSEVIVPKLNARSNKYHFNMSKEILNVLQEKQAPDHFIYNHFLKKFDSLVDAFGRERMAHQVSKLRKLTENLMTKCKLNKKPSVELTGINKPWSDMVEGYTVGNTTDKRCQRIAMTELAIIRDLRDRQHKEVIARFGLPNDPRLHALNIGAVPLVQLQQEEEGQQKEEGNRVDTQYIPIPAGFSKLVSISGNKTAGRVKKFGV
ncbi:hypothetical protein Pcinc_022014 [Petrolisthes cinctipes]|uniref:Sulfotransferase n=1 Tax=Petrolisthes cinctipes TaxID=88211 RepID=A0AAE1FFL3_PETCI|nr:hypothetical protein Pcinc_022014 [Petrolisthes cinctipes]